jgi:hypothetical protein
MAKTKTDELVAVKNDLSKRFLHPQASWRAQPMPLGRRLDEAHKNPARNLHSVGVGLKIVKGRRTRTLCVRFYVAKKLPLAEIRSAARLPKRVDGLPTDVIESPLMVFHAAMAAVSTCSADRRSLIRPIIGGISAAHVNVNESTLGCFCSSLRPEEQGRQYILGCNHSFANLNAGAQGDPILQPSSGDGGTPPDNVATLARFVPLKLGGTEPNMVDAAIALLPDPVPQDMICTVGKVKGTKKAKLHMRVCKHGRTTAYTKGEVVDISLNPFIATLDGGQSALFVNQYRIEPTSGYNSADDPALNGAFVGPGDSGSVIVDTRSKRAVALHFAGAFGISVANPILEVCRELEISIP